VAEGPGGKPAGSGTNVFDLAPAGRLARIVGFWRSWPRAGRRLRGILPGMPVLESHVDTASAEFAENREHMNGLVGDLRARLEAARSGGGPEALRRHRDQGKRTARERIERLLDPSTPFLEIGALAGYEMYDGAAPSAGMVTGIGRVRGREVERAETSAQSRARSSRTSSIVTIPRCGAASSTSWIGGPTALGAMS